MPKIWVFDGAVDALCHGADLYFPGIVKLHDKINRGDLVAVFTLKDELICIGKADVESDEMMKDCRGIAVKTTKVFMDREIYSL